MTRDELMQIGHDAGFDTSELTGEVIALLECVAEHAEAKERTARIEAQQRLADMKKLAAKAGLAHRKAVQEAVSDAVAAVREACAEIATAEDNIVDVPGYSAQLGDARATARKIEKAIRARGTPCL